MFTSPGLKKKGLAVLLLTASSVLSAQDIHQQDSERFNPQALTQVPAIDSLPQFSDANFVYDPLSESLDLKRYLETYTPHLLDYYQLISHWSGYYSISPKVVLALMELNLDVMPSALGPLNENTDFSQLLQQQLKKLSSYFYDYQRVSQQGLQREVQVVQDENTPQTKVILTAATAALIALMQESLYQMGQQSREQDKTVINADIAYQDFLAIYGQLFGETVLEASLAPEFDESNAQQAAVDDISALTPPTDMMQMPWRQGYTWISNGAHSHTGSGYPLSSIDVSYNWPGWGAQTYSVASAHSGWVSVFSACQVRVTNPNGWGTNYYHLDHIEVNDGQWVDGNTKLGVYASSRRNALCQGGSSTGPHLHFSLLYNGAYRSLQGVNIGPYDINVGNYNYDGNCSRFWLWNSLDRVYKCAWDKLYNPGS
ncbi:M23 family metallopeptidase [Thalassomonas actiniarum]|nr:M23 family metallopeptidase [Thalassomonas actiniarum]